MQKRITIFDTVRGFTMLSMAGFHACYDLAYLYGWDMPWFTETVFQDIWRASISWVFLFIAGWMCTLSRNNVKRALKYAAAALVVWIATTLVSVDDSVNFGIIYCMAACTAVVALTRPLLQKLPGSWGIAACLVLFALTWAFQKRSTHSPTWHGLDSRARVLFRETTIRSFRLSLCALPASLLPRQHKHQATKRRHGHTPIPSRRSQSSVGMPYRSTCSISLSF